MRPTTPELCLRAATLRKSSNNLFSSAPLVLIALFLALPGNGIAQSSNPPNFAPTVVSVSPAVASQTYTFTFSDPNGYQDLSVVNVLINRFLDGRNGCYLAYSRPNNVLYLVNDSGTALLSGRVLNG